MGIYAKGNKVEAATTIIIDRIIGLFGLFIVALIAALLSFNFIADLGLAMKSLVYLIVLANCMSLLSVLFVVKKNTIIKIKFIASLINFASKFLSNKLLGNIQRLFNSLDSYKKSGKTILLALLISMTGHSLNALSLYCLSKSIAEDEANIEHCFLAMQVGNAVGAALPLPNGVGGRDIIIQNFLEASDVKARNAVFLSIAFSLVMTFWSFVGGFFFIFSKYKLSSEKLIYDDT